MRDLIEEYSSFDDASHQLFENSVDRDRNDNISGGEVVVGHPSSSELSML